jgi:2-methylisocitrate lyase-like PEP mutase family enzyme
MKKVGAPLVSNQLHGGKTPILPQAQLKEMGFSAALYPTAGLFAATKALAGVYDNHVKDREVQAPLYARQSHHLAIEVCNLLLDSPACLQGCRLSALMPGTRRLL